MDLKTLYEGNSTLLKNKQYLSTQDYVKPFVDRLSDYTHEFQCQAKLADQIAIKDGNGEPIYNKVLVNAKLSPINIEGHTFIKTLNLAYGLDVKVPVMKFYVGYEYDGILFAADSNLIHYQKLEPEYAANFDEVLPLLEKSKASITPKVIENMLTKQIFDSDKDAKYLGDWVKFALNNSIGTDYGIIKIGTGMAIDAYKNLDFTHGNLKGFEVYDAFASQVRDDEKDLTNRFEKTQLINKMLGL